MASDADPPKRRVLLSSGKVIEVDAAQTPRRDLTRCVRCPGQLVQPVLWDAAGSDRWLVTLRCPDCEASITDTFSQDEVDRYDIELELGRRRLEAELVAAERRSMAEWTARVIAALRGGYLLPENF